jgi:hypothetical protein
MCEIESSRMTTLSYQPDADRYYAEGHWRPGDLWMTSPPALTRSRTSSRWCWTIAGSPTTSYGRAAVALSARLAARSVQPGDVVVLLGPATRSRRRSRCSAACTAASCSLPCRRCSNVTQLEALARQTGARAIVGFGGEKELAKCEQAAPIVEHLISLLPATLDELIAEDASDERGERGADDIAMVMHSSGTTSAPKGIVHSSNTLRYATEGICRRWRLGGDDVTSWRPSSGSWAAWSSGTCPCCSPAARRADEPVEPDEALRPHRGAPLLVRAADADARRRHLVPRRPRHATSPRCACSRRRASRRSGGSRCRTRSGSTAGDYGLSEVPGHAAHALREPQAKMLTTEGRPYDGTEIRILGPGGAPLRVGEVGDVVVNGPSRFLFFLGNDELTRDSLTGWGGYRPATSAISTRRPPSLCRPQ